LWVKALANQFFFAYNGTMIGSSLSLTLDEIPLDSASIPRELLDLDEKERSNLLPWNGQFSPQLVEVLLRTFSMPDNRVCDPFLGSECKAPKPLHLSWLRRKVFPSMATTGFSIPVSSAALSRIDCSQFPKQA